MTFPQLGRFVDPGTVATHFFLKEGDQVADLGAGSGFYLQTLARAVGPTGRVYACEIQRPLVEKLTALKRTLGLSNVDILWCDLEEANGVKLADRSLDAAILSNTFFQIERKDVAVREIKRILRPGGNLFVIDWTDSFGGLGPKADQVVSKNIMIDVFEAGGFVYERDYPAGDHHYGLAFKKP